MQMDIRARGFRLFSKEELGIRKLLWNRLDHKVDQIRTVFFRISDENAQKGGVDKVGKLEVVLNHGGAIHLTGKEATPLALASILCDKAGYVLDRVVGRKRRHRHRAEKN